MIYVIHKHAQHHKHGLIKAYRHHLNLGLYGDSREEPEVR